MPVRQSGLHTVRTWSSSTGTAPATIRTGSAPPARSRPVPRSARVWPSSVTSAFGWPKREPSPAASSTPATSRIMVPKRMQLR